MSKSQEGVMGAGDGGNGGVATGVVAVGAIGGATGVATGVAIEGGAIQGATGAGQPRQGSQLLRAVVENKSIEEIRGLLKSEDVNQIDPNGRSALMFASRAGNVELVNLLLTKDANINQADKSGVTALMLASIAGNVEIVNLLLTKHANINKADNSGVTALMLASQAGNVEVIKLLLKSGAEVNQADSEGNTPIMYTKNIRNADVIKLLLNSGADVNQADNFNGTVLMLACSNNNLELAKLCLQHGARPNERYKKRGLEVITALYYPLSKTTIDNMNLVELLLGYDAEYGHFRQNRKDLIRDEIEKFKNAESFFDGNFSIDPKKINLIKLRNLCQKDGIPKYLLEISEENPNYQAYKEMMEKIKTSDEDKKCDLGIYLAQILHMYDPKAFPSIVPYHFLGDAELTRQSYNNYEYLKPENFLNDDSFKEKLLFLTINPEIADQLFLFSKDWILPKEEHGVLNKLKEEYKKIPDVVKTYLANLHHTHIHQCQRLDISEAQLEQSKAQMEELEKELGSLKKQFTRLKEERGQDELGGKGEGGSYPGPKPREANAEALTPSQKKSRVDRVSPS